MSQQQESQPFGRNTCHICGGHDFTWGLLKEMYNTSFVSDEDDRRHFSDFHRENVRARKCNTCQNIQLFSANEK